MNCLRPVAKLRMSGVIPLLPVCAFVVCTGTVYCIVLLLLSTESSQAYHIECVTHTHTAVTVNKYPVKSIYIQWSKKVYRRG